MLHMLVYYLCETRTMVIYNRKCVKLKITTYKVVFQKVEINNIFMSSIYGSRSYMKWRYGGVRHGTSAGKRRDIAFGVLALLG